MGDLVELSYRHFPPVLIQKLIRTGYLSFPDRHKPEAVKRAWDRFRGCVSSIVKDRDQLS
jgi:hypothetical protein